MTISVGQVQALTVKGIQAKGGVADSVFKNNAYLKRLKENEGIYSGEKLTFPFNFKDSTQSNGSFYQGAQALSLDMYDPLTELEFNLIEQQETLVITHRDLARNSGKEARLKLVGERLKLLESCFRERMSKSIFSDGTVATGALSAYQMPGFQTFMKSSSVSYGGVSNSDVASHIAYVSSNSGTNRSITTGLIQSVIGGASEGEEKPSLGICKQGAMNALISLIQPYQRTTRENSLDNLGHSGNTLVYSGTDFIVDNLHEANKISLINEKFVRLYSHPEYNMKNVSKSDLETVDAILERLFWKGVFACNVLRYQGSLQDITEA